MEFSYKHPPALLFFFLPLLCFVSKAHPPTEQKASNNKITSLLVFGDSTVDPGNNNNINTIFKSNFLPYGSDFADQKPTGRFTDGRLCTDFIASYSGIKEYVPPYLDSSLSIEEIMTGVSFASAGSGFDPLTPRLSNVIPLSKQLDYFREYKKRVESAIGKQRTEDHIKKAIFVVSAGTNDFVVNYFGVPVRRNSYSVTNYQQFLMQNVKDFIQGLWDEGARKIAVVGLPPMGCLPIVITLNSNNPLLERDCIEMYSSVARDHNLMLQKELNSTQMGLANQGAQIYYIDIYGPLIDMIQGHAKSGFDEVNIGCCGSGYLESTYLCNPNSYVCPDASKYVFWDAIHPTEKAYNNVFKDIRPIVDLIISG